MAIKQQKQDSTPFSNNSTCSPPPQCFHCGLPCWDQSLTLDQHHFCCTGCLAVFQILHDKGLGQYYQLASHPGKPGETSSPPAKYAYLDEEQLHEQIVDFDDGKYARVTWHIPTIHCASCVWLLENLYKIEPRIHSASVQSVKKELRITYHPDKIKLSEVVTLLASLGYEPLLNLDTPDKKLIDSERRADLIKIAVAGFCFGNVMLLSFPEYLASESIPEHFQQFFRYLSMVLSLPALFYSGGDWLRSAWRAVYYRFVNLEVPIALGLLALLGRSVYEVVSQTGSGYFDSLCAFVFFLAIGKFFQKKTFASLSFERDYRSYFPLSIQREDEHGQGRFVPVEKLSPGDVIIVRNHELVPADGILLSSEGHLDYSFVTGEADPIAKLESDKVLAGGRVMGACLRLQITKRVSQSFLAGLWQEKERSSWKKFCSFSDKISPYFTWSVLAIASFTAVYWAWLGQNPGLGVYAFSSVLIVACPCALALSAPFTHGSMIRLLARRGIYFKNGHVLERLNSIDHLVFDKTGTLTIAGARLRKVWGELSPRELPLVLTLASQSVHPVSVALVALFPKQRTPWQVQEYQEVVGQGIVGKVNNTQVQIGKPNWVTSQAPVQAQLAIAIDGKLLALFVVENQFRPGWQEVLRHLAVEYSLHLVSGDSEREKQRVAGYFSPERLHFAYNPFDKTQYIQKLKNEGHHIAMIGDGLNDAGALWQSDIGIAVMENNSHFSPACDLIIRGNAFNWLPQIFAAARASKRIIHLNFALSLSYNMIGIGFAVCGLLSPLFAAILMPLSSFSVMAVATSGCQYVANRLGLEDI